MRHFHTIIAGWLPLKAVGDWAIAGMGGTELLSILAKLLPSKGAGIHAIVGTEM